MAEGDRDSGVRLAEPIADLSLGTDLGLGQPMEHALRVQAELEVLFNQHNANGSSAPTSISATYLRVSVSA